MTQNKTISGMSQKEMDKQKERDKHFTPDNTFTMLQDKLAIVALGDRVIILQDPYKTGYECSTCDGTRVDKNAKCPLCKGSGTETSRDIAENTIEVKCRICGGSGQAKCPACNGKGGLVIAPEESERRPSTGKVMSVGPDVKLISVGDRVIFSNYAGTKLDLRNSEPMVVMHENEVVGLLYGIASLSGVLV